jgi:hypothetical protein
MRIAARPLGCFFLAVWLAGAAPAFPISNGELCRPIYAIFIVFNGLHHLPPRSAAIIQRQRPDVLDNHR